MSAYEVDAATMCDALSQVPGVEHVVLEFDARGNGVLRVQVPVSQDHNVVVGAAVAQLRHQFGLGVDGRRLRITGPAGKPVVAVVETLSEDGTVERPAAVDRQPAQEGADEDLDPDLGLDLTATSSADMALFQTLTEAFADAPETPTARSAPTLATAPTPALAPAAAPAPAPAAARPPLPQHVPAVACPPPSAHELLNGSHRTTGETASAAPVPPAADPVRVSRRVVVERVVVSTERQEVRASVHLRHGEAVHEGIATRPATGAGVHRALAAATASAVEVMVPSSARLEVDHIDLLQVGPDHIAVVVLSLLTSSGIDRLTGSALVRGDSRDAVVRATLDALNRRANIAGERAEASAHL